MIRLKLSAIVLVPVLLLTVGGAQNTNPNQRLTPSEIDSISATGAGAGTSGVGGIQTRVLKGDPTKTGLYTIQLTVPANTKIEAHTHPDDRVATVISERGKSGTGPHSTKRNLKRSFPAVFTRSRPTWPILPAQEIRPSWCR
jgi:hypothetical protein